MTKKLIEEIAELQRRSLPVIHPPKLFESQEDYLRFLAIEGAYAKYGNHLSGDVTQRIEEELAVITSIKATNWYLFHRHIVKLAKEKLNVLFGSGRGSAAGSIVNYCLGLTAIDPMKYGLLWERFITSNRITLPDIDFDLENGGRPKLINWLKEEYGEDHVARISTNEGKGIHACGVVVTDQPVKEYTSILYREDPENNHIPTQCTAHSAMTIEEEGLYKIDLLEMETLSDIKKIISLVQAKHDIYINLDAIKPNDNKTLQLFRAGDSDDVLHFDCMRKYLQQLQPTKFEELVAMNTLFTPGLFDLIPEYIERKKNSETIRYEFQFEKKYLSETYGLVIYQEQLMQIAQDVAGFTKVESEALRKALQKRNKLDIEKLAIKFKEGTLNNGFSDKETERIWSKYFEFEDVPFLLNKSHAVCYAWIGYQCAYLKAHYPEEYAEVLSARNKKKKEK